MECGHFIDLHHKDMYFTLQGDRYLCPTCVHVTAAKEDVTVNPLPAHMQEFVEPHIKWRESQAIAKFYLEVRDVVT